MADLRLPELNRVMLAGRLTRDPELQHVASGRVVCNMDIAVSEKYTKDGESKESTLFTRVVVWGKAAEYCGEHLSKGHPVLVEGKLATESWEDKETGSKRPRTHVVAFRVQTLDWSMDAEDDSDDDMPF